MDIRSGDTLISNGESESTVLSALEILQRVKQSGKSVRLDFMDTEVTLDLALEAIRRAGLESWEIWINTEVSVFGDTGLKELRNLFPESTSQCSIDHLAHVMLESPEDADDSLDRLAGWGVNRFSMKWHTPMMKEALHRLSEWGHDVNIQDVPDLKAFLQAVLLLPRSITSDFSFPNWQYFGLGWEGNGYRQKYDVQRVPEVTTTT